MVPPKPKSPGMGIFTHLFRLPRQGRGTGVLIKYYYGSGAFIVSKFEH